MTTTTAEPIARPRELIARRWPMCGGGTAYAVEVPEEYSHGAHVIHVHYDAGLGKFDGRRLVTVADAMTPAEHWTRPVGWERYDAWREIEAAAMVAQLDYAREVFPELADVETWPLLWVPGRTLPAEVWHWTARHGWTKVGA